MSNLLPPDSQKLVRREFRARFLLAASFILLFSAIMFALAFVPPEVSLIFFSSPPAQPVQGDINAHQDSQTLAQAKAILAAMRPLMATSSFADVLVAISERGQGVTIDDISYMATGKSLTLAGHANTPDEVNTFRENLQNDPHFANVSVPVSALLGSGSGTFNITLKIVQ